MGTKTFRLAAALAGLVMVTAACGTGSTPRDGVPSDAPGIGAQDPPVTLRMAVADKADRPSAIVARTFVEQVAALSDGNMTIEPTFDAGIGTDQAFETGVTGLLTSGDADVAIVATRAWDLAGVTSLRALQAPFLIDSDALALAVAKSVVAAKALDGLSAAGVTGLAMWPEDLRHLYSFPRCGKDFRTPSEIAGAEISIIASQVSRDVIKALGGIDSTFETGGSDAEACRLHGVERGLSGIGVPLSDAVATSNVVLFPKYEVLAMNMEAFGHLSAGQQAVLRKAATAAQADGFSHQPDEATQAAAWCAGGGTVQVATADQVEALKAATASVTAALDQDPLTKELIAAIGELKTSVAARVFDGTCEPPVASRPEPSVAPQDTTGFLATVIPDGTYRTEITEADLIAKGASATFAAENAGVKTWTFKGQTYTQEHGDCEGTYDVRETHLVWHGCDSDGGSFLWRPDGDGITILPILEDGLTPQDRIAIAAYFDRVLTKID